MQPKISICIPFHWMKNWQFFLARCLESIEKQTFKDYEVILAKVSSMPVTSNRVIGQAKGELVKILYMDDWFAHPDALKDIVEFMDNEVGHWLITGVDTNPTPMWTDDIQTGNNKLGSPSALTFRNLFNKNLLFDEKLSWLLDCDLYKRLQKEFGTPRIMSGVNVNIGVGDHQMTNIMSNDYKLSEHEYVRNKYK